MNTEVIGPLVASFIMLCLLAKFGISGIWNILSDWIDYLTRIILLGRREARITRVQLKIRRLEKELGYDEVGRGEAEVLCAHPSSWKVWHGSRSYYCRRCDTEVQLELAPRRNQAN